MGIYLSIEVVRLLPDQGDDNVIWVDHFFRIDQKNSVLACQMQKLCTVAPLTYLRHREDGTDGIESICNLSRPDFIWPESLKTLDYGECYPGGLVDILKTISTWSRKDYAIIYWDDSQE